MSNPATPLNNRDAIEQINRSINFLISNFLLPTARQTAANALAITETREAIAETNQGIRDLRESLAIQRDASDDAADETVMLERRANYSETAVEALRRDAISDRRKAEEDRQRWQTNFDTQLAEIRALGEQNRALLSALATTNRRIENLEQAG
ncbi:MAG: hypothetical protein AB8B99_23170 [Phormidesmis sp.]